MRQTIEALISHCERGRLSRRDFVSASAALAGATPAATIGETFRPATMQHVTLPMSNAGVRPWREAASPPWGG